MTVFTRFRSRRALGRSRLGTLSTVTPVADGGVSPSGLRERAESLAADWPDYDLDFTPESLERLDRLVEAEFEDVEASPQETAVLDTAGYLAAVFLRNLRCEWVDQGDELSVQGRDGEAHVDPVAVATDCLRGEDSFGATYQGVSGRYSVPEETVAQSLEELTVDLGREAALDDESVDPSTLAAEAVDLWPSYDLDYTPESLRRIDTIVATGLAMAKANAAVLGAYIGAVFARTYDGYWEHHDNTGWVVTVPTDGRSDPPMVAIQNVLHSGLHGEASFAEIHDSFLETAAIDGPELLADADAATARDPLVEELSAERKASYRSHADRLVEEWPGYELDYSPASLARLDDLVATEFDYQRPEADSVTLVSGPRADAAIGYLVTVARRAHDADVRSRDGDELLVLDGPDGTAEVELRLFVSACLAGQSSFSDTYGTLLSETGLRSTA